MRPFFIFIFPLELPNFRLDVNERKEWFAVFCMVWNYELINI